jgi:hypothetical protein
VAYSLNFVYNTKTSIQNLIKRVSKPSKPIILAKQAKQASLRCQKLQASKLSLLSLARLLIPNSANTFAQATPSCPVRARPDDCVTLGKDHGAVTNLFKFKIMTQRGLVENECQSGETHGGFCWRNTPVYCY